MKKGKESKLQIISPPAQVSKDFVVQSMSQVSLRNLEIIGLKNQNNNLEDLALKRGKPRK